MKLLNLEVQGILDGILAFNLMALIRREYNNTDEVQINFEEFLHWLVMICLNFWFYRYAEMPSEIKNSISHRGKALKALKEYFEDAKANDDFQEPENKRPKNFTDTK